jgi:hypothetical protein
MKRVRRGDTIVGFAFGGGSLKAPRLLIFTSLPSFPVRFPISATPK